MLDALIGVYERNAQEYPSTAILPYSQGLNRFPAHLQQLDMESNGKSVNRDGKEITSQNHSYAVDADSLQCTGLEITHINLLDNTVEGVKCDKDMIFSVQYHPESAPGPQDSEYLFDKFVDNMNKYREGQKNA